MVRNTNRAFHVSLVFLAFFIAQASRGCRGLAAAPRRRAAVGALLVLRRGGRDGPCRPASASVCPSATRSLPPTALSRACPTGRLRRPERARGDCAQQCTNAIFHRKACRSATAASRRPRRVRHPASLPFPEDDALVLLDAIGIRHVLWHFATPAAAEAFFLPATPPSLSVAARSGADVLFGPRRTAPSARPSARRAPSIRSRARAGAQGEPGGRSPAPPSSTVTLGARGPRPSTGDARRGCSSTRRPQRVAASAASDPADAPAVPLALSGARRTGSTGARAAAVRARLAATLIEHPAASPPTRHASRRGARANVASSIRAGVLGGTWDIDGARRDDPDDEPDDESGRNARRHPTLQRVREPRGAPRTAPPSRPGRRAIVDDGSPTARRRRACARERLGGVGRPPARPTPRLGSAYREGFRRARARFAASCRWTPICRTSRATSGTPRRQRAADLVIGSRYLHGVSVVNWSLKRLALSVAATPTRASVTGLPCADCTSWLPVFRREVLAGDL